MIITLSYSINQSIMSINPMNDDDLPVSARNRSQYQQSVLSSSSSRSTPPTPPLSSSESPFNQSFDTDIANNAYIVNTIEGDNENPSITRIPSPAPHLNSDKRKALEFITSWVNGTLDLCDPDLLPIQEFRLNPIEYRWLLKEIETNPKVFGFFQDKISSIYSTTEQTLRVRMPHPMHQSPLHRLMISLDTFLNTSLANFPYLLSDLEVSGDTPFIFFSDQQHSKRERQQRERKDFAKRIERVASSRYVFTFIVFLFGILKTSQP